MTPEEQRQWDKLISEDFQIMRQMLNDIEIKILGMRSVDQRTIYQPILYLISQKHAELSIYRSNK